MKKLLIRLNTIEDIRRFVDITGQYKSAVELKNENYSIDGKSIMGIFSLDLSKTVTAVVEGEDADELIAALSPFAASLS